MLDHWQAGSRSDSYEDVTFWKHFKTSKSWWLIISLWILFIDFSAMAALHWFLWHLLFDLSDSASPASNTLACRSVDELFTLVRWPLNGCGPANGRSEMVAHIFFQRFHFSAFVKIFKFICVKPPLVICCLIILNLANEQFLAVSFANALSTKFWRTCKWCYTMLLAADHSMTKKKNKCGSRSCKGFLSNQFQ